MNRVAINNVPSLDLARIWVYPLDEDKEGYFLYPNMEEDDMVDEHGYPTPTSMGDFYWKWNKIIEAGHSISLSRWTRWQTPPTQDGYPQDIYDGDIIEVIWIEGLREILIRYSVEYFGIPEGRWCLHELGNHVNREYIPLAEMNTQGEERRLKSMRIIGHRWEKQKRAAK